MSIFKRQRDPISTTSLTLIKLTLVVCLSSTSSFAEKKPKAGEQAEAAGAPTEETDPLKKELKPGEIYNCEADIFYEWETAGETPVQNKEFFETLVERGKDGTLCKAQLESRLTEAKNRAQTACRKSHNVSDCTISKIGAAKNELNLLDFQTKRTLTANLIQSCEDKNGKCLESSNSELRCQIYRSPDSISKKEAEAAVAPAAAKK